MDPRALTLRRAFDANFAAAPDLSAGKTEDFLAIRVGGDPCALRASHVSRLVSHPTVLPVPSRRPSVLGVTGIRGVIVVVHSLGVLLGGARRTPRQLLLVASDETLGLAFDELDGFVRLAGTSDTPAITTGGVTRVIVDVGALAQAISSGATGPTRSRT